MGLKKIDPEKLLLTQPTEADKLMFEFYKKNPDIACMHLLKQDLDVFQRIIVKGNISHPYVINALARGSGKTRIIAMLSILDAMFNPKIHVGCLGPQFRTAKLAFNEILAIYAESEFLQACVKDISKQPDVWSMEFWNGAFIYALPLAADSKMSIRGIRLHRCRIDEYPHVPKAVLDAVINPMLATTLNPMKNVRKKEKEKLMVSQGLMNVEDIEDVKQNSVQGFSSAYFQFNHMWETIVKYRALAAKQKAETGKSDYAVYVFNYQDASDGFFDAKMIQHAKDNSAPIIFRMEYLSEFPSDSDGFFKRSLIDSCISKAPNDFYLELKGESGYKYFMGIDPARTNDAFAIQILKLVGQEMRLVRSITYQSVPFPIVAQDIRSLMHDYDFQMIGMDAGGGGLAMKDLFADPMTANSKDDILLDMNDEINIGIAGRKILKMFDFSSSWIAEANYDLQSSLEHKRLMFPNLWLGDTFIKPKNDDSDIDDKMSVEFFKTLEELQAIVVTPTKTGVLHFDVPNQGMRKDRYSALLVAHKLLYDFIKQGYQKKELASGGWFGQNGLITDGDDDSIQWNETGALDLINRYKNARNDAGTGSLVDR